MRQLPLLLLCTLPLFACGSSQKRHALRAAEQARKQGDLLTAAEHLQRACELDPKDQKVCEQAEQTRLQAVKEGLKKAESQLTSGKLFAGLSELVRVSPQDREGSGDALRVRFGEALHKHCDKTLEQAGDTPLAWVDYVRCYQREHETLKSEAFDQRVRERHSKSADALTRLASAAHQAQRPGQAYSLMDLAICVEPNLERKTAQKNLHASYMQAISIPLALHFAQTFDGEALDTMGQCEQLRKRWPVLSCTGGPDGRRALHAKYELHTEKPRHEQEKSHHEVEYVARVESVKNPDRPAAEQRVRSAKSALESARSAYQEAETTCNSAKRVVSATKLCSTNDCEAYRKKEEVCERARNAERTKREAEYELSSAEHDLRDTPSMIDREITALHKYTEVRHRDLQGYKIYAEISSEQPPTRWSDSTDGDIEFTSVDRPGFAKANVKPSSYKKPTSKDFNMEALRRAADFIQATLERELSQRAEHQSGADPLRDGEIEQWLYERALRGEDPSKAYAETLSKRSPGGHPAVKCQ